MTAYANVADAVAAMRDGALDYLTKPVDVDTVLYRVRKILEGQQLLAENRALREALRGRYRVEGIVAEINQSYLGATVEVLFEEKVKGRWKGRTPTNKLVFLESDDDLKGRIVPVTITWAGPWSMQAARHELQMSPYR